MHGKGLLGSVELAVKNDGLIPLPSSPHKKVFSSSGELLNHTVRLTFLVHADGCGCISRIPVCRLVTQLRFGHALPALGCLCAGGDEKTNLLTYAIGFAAPTFETNHEVIGPEPTLKRRSQGSRL
jgi:hypothetical protein